MQEIEGEDFDDLIHRVRPFVLVFKAKWSGSGDLMIATLERISPEFKLKYDFFLVDVDRSPDLSQTFGIRTIPTTFIFKNQEVVDHFEGAVGSGNLTARLENHLK